MRNSPSPLLRPSLAMRNSLSLLPRPSSATRKSLSLLRLPSLTTRNSPSPLLHPSQTMRNSPLLLFHPNLTMRISRCSLSDPRSNIPCLTFLWVLWVPWALCQTSLLSHFLCPLARTRPCLAFDFSCSMSTLLFLFSLTSKLEFQARVSKSLCVCLHKKNHPVQSYPKSCNLLTSKLVHTKQKVIECVYAKKKQTVPINHISSYLQT